MGFICLEPTLSKKHPAEKSDHENEFIHLKLVLYNYEGIIILKSGKKCRTDKSKHISI